MKKQVIGVFNTQKNGKLIIHELYKIPTSEFVRRDKKICLSLVR